MRSKDEARKQWKRERLTFTQWPSDEVCKQILSDPAFHQARWVGLYSARLGEVDLSPLWKARPEACVFPKVVGPSHMEFHHISDLKDLRPGFAGILEPRGGSPVDSWGGNDWILVPGSAFDQKGSRVGSGAGFYDRFLVGVSARPVGVCWESQIVPQGLAQEPTDVRMWAIFTERRALKIG